MLSNYPVTVQGGWSMPNMPHTPQVPQGPSFGGAEETVNSSTNREGSPLPLAPNKNVNTDTK